MKPIIINDPRKLDSVPTCKKISDTFERWMESIKGEMMDEKKEARILERAINKTVFDYLHSLTYVSCVSRDCKNRSTDSLSCGLKKIILDSPDNLISGHICRSFEEKTDK